MNKLIKRYGIAAKELKALLPYYIIAFALICAVSAVLCIFGIGGVTLFTGAAVGTAVSLLSFAALAISCQNAAHMNEKSARLSMNGTYAVRYISIFIILGVLMYFRLINPLTAILPLFVPRIGYTLNAIFFDKDKKRKE